jgi:hypothetical protein
VVLIVDVIPAIGDRGHNEEIWAGVEMNTGRLIISGALAGAIFLFAAGAGAQTVSPRTQLAQAGPSAAEPATQPVQRPPRRLRIYPRYQAEPDDVYPRYYPGPNAVRVCNATYVPEYRPSGTVIVPRMSCVWRRGG